MREVIEDLLAAEAEAKQIVRLAREEAERVATEAERRARAFLADARGEMRAQAEKLIAAAVEEAQALKRQQLQRTAADVQTEIRLDPDENEAVVQALTCFIGGGATGNDRPKRGG